MGNNIWKSLEDFVRKEACISLHEKITAETTIEGDLGQTGDEADMFMESFFRWSGIERGDYDFQNYFLMEGEGVLFHILKKYILGKSHSVARETLTVGMLYTALVNGSWDSALSRR